jgi:DNA-directed RNA polymerase beta' subunit
MNEERKISREEWSMMLINRCARLNRLLVLNAPEVIIMAECKLVQTALDKIKELGLNG